MSNTRFKAFGWELTGWKASAAINALVGSIFLAGVLFGFFVAVL